MEENDIATITKRSIRGIVALVSRTFFMRAISMTTGLLLAAFLSPSTFGVFYIVSAIIPLLSYFSDIGLAASLIQKKEEITQDDLKTTFTIQQGLVITIVIIALLLSNFVGQFYSLEGVGIYLFQAVVIAFFLSSLKTIPSIILERNLQFQKLVIPEIVETLFFNVTVLVLAIQGFGVMSFTYAVLARGISGLVTIYIIAPWKISLGISRESAKKLLSFGIPFQANSFLALLKDDLLVMYLGKVLPLAQVGYIGFAQKMAFTPLRLIMDNVIRITFPSFSRLQHDKNSLAVGIEKALLAVSFFIFPSFFGLILLSPYAINLIPKFAKWEPALLSLSFFAINATLSSISTPLTNALNAIGKIKITLYLMIFWTILTWILTPLSILFFGFNGVAGVSAVIASSVVLVVYIARRYIAFNILKAVKYPFFASILMGTVLYFIRPFLVVNLFTLILTILFSAIV
ncbi:MAG: oligosaccharide flippase family protein, partial [Candidatus Parcubacteria bacterium]|nr:oligosaccharide flippase family protein [Candidatus Parcubacteria bacterium]